VKVIVVPAMVNVPVRAVPVLGATVNWTAPFPLPVAPWVIVMKAAPLVAVQAHPEAVFTATEPVVPPEGTAVVTCPSVTSHVGAGAAGLLEHAPAASPAPAESEAQNASRAMVWSEQECFIGRRF
jgi:hypothetical protein